MQEVDWCSLAECVVETGSLAFDVECEIVEEPQWFCTVDLQLLPECEAGLISRLALHLT